MYFICHMTSQDHSVEMSCIYMGESFLEHVTTLKSLVIIAILIVKCFIKNTNLINIYYHGLLYIHEYIVGHGTTTEKLS